VPQKEQVTKLEAAQRQLTVATELFFRDADPVSVHTLVAASYNIIRDLSKHRGAPDMVVKGFLLTTVSKAQRKEVAKWLNSFENFFKHADHDPNGEIEFSAGITEAMLIDAWAQYERLEGSLTEAGKVLKFWTGNLKGDASPELKQVVSLLRKRSKWQFYETVRAMMRSST
jgi:hypothetical protein